MKNFKRQVVVQQWSKIPRSTYKVPIWIEIVLVNPFYDHAKVNHVKYGWFIYFHAYFEGMDNKLDGGRKIFTIGFPLGEWTREFNMVRSELKTHEALKGEIKIKFRKTWDNNLQIQEWSMKRNDTTS